MQSVDLAVIGGSGFYQLDAIEHAEPQSVVTPFGSVELDIGLCVDTHRSVAFLARHAKGHKIPPHKVNYRANLWALHQLGVKRVFAINAVGGISADCGPGKLVVPDQIIDYTYGREHTFADSLEGIDSHIDFTWPYDNHARQALLNAADTVAESVVAAGCYACMQGPRLETAAEIKRLANDGNTLVGMTAMPEAALARELGIEYASLCVVANWAAGLTQAPIAISEILTVLEAASARAQRIIRHALIDSVF